MRDRSARLVVAMTCVAVLLVAILRDGHAVESPDVRTYLEMTRGIVLHGLPYLDNGPAERFAALRVPWNVVAGGHYWGVYDPLYPYFGAPFLALGGIRLLTAATCATLVPITIVTFLLARRLLEDERWAAFAAATTAFSTPILAKSLETTAYPLAVLFAVSATYAALASVDASGRRSLVLAAACGGLGALATGSHILCLPLAASLIAALAVADPNGVARGPSWFERTALRSFWPTRATLARALVATAGMALSLVPLALLDHVRFGTYNPFTHGPTPWRGSADNGVADQTMAAHLRFAAPCLVLLAFVVVGLVVASALSRTRAAAVRAVVVVVAALALATMPELRERAGRYVTLAYAFVVDTSAVTLVGYERFPGGFGWTQGAFVVKSTLQCTPILIVVGALPRLASGLRHRTLVVLAPAVGLYAYLVLRANLPLFSGLGFPWVYIRFTLPALPMLVVVATLVVRELEPRRRDAIVALVVAAVITLVLCANGRDRPIYRQVIVLVVPLVLGLASLLAVRLARANAARRGMARTLVAAACGLGFAIGIGHDLRANVSGKWHLNQRMAAVAPVLPERFAIFGHLRPLDQVLTLRAERDIEYADLYQLGEFTEIRPLLEHWFEEDRPVFYVFELGELDTSPWPDLDFELVEPREHVIRVSRRPPP